MQSPVRVACVVSTVGRPVHLDRLLRSLAEQTVRPVQVIVVDQSRTAGTAGVVGEWSDRLPLRRITSGRGASLGRNAGLAVLGTDVDVVTFPDDDVRLAADALALAAQAFTAADPTTGVIAGAGIYPTGNRTHRLPAEGPPATLSRDQIHGNTIEWTCFFRASFLGAVGGFDESLGVGNPTPWQSTAGLDLLLRGVRDGWDVLFDPAIVLYETSDKGGPDDRSYRIKCRHQARGAGRVYRRHFGPRTYLRVLGRLVGGAGFYLCTARPARASWCLQETVGLLEGLTGRVFFRAPEPEPLEARRFRDPVTSGPSAAGRDRNHAHARTRPDS